MGRTKGELAEGFIRVNSDNIKALLKKKYVSQKSVSIFVLEQDPSTLSFQLKHGSMSEDKFNKLMDYFKVPLNEREKYLDKEEEQANESVSAQTVKKDSNSDTLDLLVVGVNTLYETQIDTNKLLKELIEQVKVTNTKLERLEKRVGTIENATGQILSKTIMGNDKSDDILKNVQDMKSTINVIKGRTTDITDIVKTKRYKVV